MRKATIMMKSDGLRYAHPSELEGVDTRLETELLREDMAILNRVAGVERGAPGSLSIHAYRGYWCICITEYTNARRNLTEWMENPRELRHFVHEIADKLLSDVKREPKTLSDYYGI